MLHIIIFFTLLKCLTTYPVSSEKSQIVRIYTKGVMPFETDVLLPYSIIQKIYDQQLAGSPFKTKIRAVIRPSSSKVFKKYRKSRNNLITPTQNALKGHLHFQRDRLNARNFKLYDEDGEYLLNFKYPENIAVSAIQQPSITNTTTMYVDKGPLHSYEGNTKYGSGKVPSSKKLVQHVWINLK